MGEGCLSHGSQEAERQEERGQGQDISFKDTTHFLQPGPTSLNSPFSYELINGLIH
jgi:hypothetical protein